jgi:hypothetical protein
LRFAKQKLLPFLRMIGSLILARMGNLKVRIRSDEVPVGATHTEPSIAVE